MLDFLIEGEWMVECLRQGGAKVDVFDIILT